VSTRPAGRTFAERWPDDAATADWLGGGWVPIGAGGLAGVLTLPMWLAAVFAGRPVLLFVPVVLLILGAALGRRRSRFSRAAGRAWIVGAYLVIAAFTGLVLAFVAQGVLSVACPTTGCDPTEPRSMNLLVVVGEVIILLGNVLASILSAVTAVRGRDRFVRPPVVVDPEYEAWRDRRLVRDTGRTGDDSPSGRIGPTPLS
jgi:hypothetical protein